MTRMHRILFAFLLCGLLLAPVVSHAQDKTDRLPLTREVIEDSLRTDWYGIYLGDKKIGYAKTQMVPHKVGTTLTYKVISDMKAKVKSMGVLFEMDLQETMEFAGTAPYGLIRGYEKQVMGPSRQEVTISKKDRRWQVETRTNGKNTSKRIPDPKYTLADLLTPAVWIQSRPKKGDTVSRIGFSFEKLKLTKVKYQLKESKTIRIKGVDVIVHDVEVRHSDSKSVSLDRWDAEGNLLSSKIDGVFELRSETEKQAKDLDTNTDLFAMGTVKIDRPLGNTDNMNGLILEIVGKELALTSSSWQTVKTNKNGKIICKIGKAFANPIKATKKERTEALEVTTQYPADHPKVQTLARKAIGDAKTIEDKTKRLVKFVHKFIRPSLNGKGFIVLDLLEKKRGDCTAYAALFTTLARAAGVPCREVDGLMYMGDFQKSFGGHAWNEVIINGHWHPIDASRGQFEVSPDRVALGTDLRGGLQLLKNTGQISFRLIQVQR